MARHFSLRKKNAGNGFYYLGRGDEVRCAFCKVELVNWVEGDDPNKEHLYWSPNCHFVCRLTGSNTVDCKKNLSPEIYFDIYYRYARKHLGTNTTERNKHGSCVPVDATLKLPGAAHPRYESEDARLRSFQDSQCMRQSPENLARAGFFYVGPDDETKCYYFDGGLKDWGPDDVPWEQHARWFGSCAYVKSVKGQDHLQKAMTKGYDMLAPTVERVVKQRTLRGSLDPDCKLCIICDKAMRNVYYVPCEHFVACSKCSSAVDNCPLCQREIRKCFYPRFQEELRQKPKAGMLK